MTPDEAQSNDERSTDSAAAGTEPHQEPAFLEMTVRERLAHSWWSVAWFLLFRLTPPFCHGWRRMMLRAFGATVHRSAKIDQTVRVDYPWNLRVGPLVRIQHGVILNCMGTIEIGDGTLVSQYAHLCAGTHEYQKQRMRVLRCPIRIGKNVWIAADAFVGPDVTIGDECLLAARSSAFHDLPTGQVCIGEPAEPRFARYGDRSKRRQAEAEKKNPGEEAPRDA